MEQWILPGFWLGLMLLMLVIEAATVSLVSIWFAAGALTALILSLLSVPVLFQAAAFFLVSIILFLVMKGRIQEFFRFRHDQDGARSVLGKEGLVSESIDPVSGAGRVRIGGQDWKAASRVPVEKGSPVRAVSLQGVTLDVMPIDKNQAEKEKKL